MTDTQTLILYLITIFVTSLLCAFFTNKRTAKRTILKLGVFDYEYRHTIWILVVISFLPMIFVAGTRVDTGADYTQYVWNYSRVQGSNDLFSFMIESREPIYILSEIINELFFGDNVNAWFFSMATLTFFILIIALCKIERDINFTVFALLFGLYIYMHMFNYVRQFFATSLVALAIIYGLDKSYLKFFVIIFFATLMHQSSILFGLLIILITNTNFLFGKKYHFFILISPLFFNAVVFILSKIPLFSLYIERYFNGDFSLGIGWIIDIIPAVVLYFLNYRVIRQSNLQKGRILAELSLLIIPTRLLSYYSYAAGRLFIAFALISIIAFSMLINIGSNKNIRIFLAFIILFCYYIFTFYIGNNSEVFPYTSLFE